MKKNQTRRALLMSVLSLLLCCSMLIGTTFAWFTDSVTSANNIIASGNLDVEMYWADGTKAVPTDESGWTDASTGAIFSYELWEPGYTQVRHIKIANEGTLALKYKVSIVPNGEVSKLADVIDVYYMDPAAQVAGRAELTDSNKLGTLTEVLAKLGETGYGELVAGASDTITIAFKMQETAGNEYQNLAIGTDFSVQLLATQLTAESDSFNDQYDKGAWHPDFTVTSVEDLAAALAIGGKIQVNGTLNAGATQDVPNWTNAPAEFIFDATTLDALMGGKYVLEQGSRYGFVGLISAGESLALSDMEITANSQWPVYLSNYGGTLTLEDIDVTATQGAGIYPYGTNGTTTIKSATVNQKALSNEFAASTPWAGTAIATSNGHNLIIEDGTYVGSTWGVYVYNSGANVTINGGTFKAPKVIQADGVWSTGGNKSVVTVNDGNFDGALYLDWGTTPPEIYINGGNFTNFSATVNGAAKLVIKGGTFDADPSAYVASGYKAVENNGKYVVVSNEVEEVVSTPAQLEKALTDAAAAGAGDTDIVLAGDVDMTGTTWTPIEVDGYNGAGIVTIEGNGATIKGLTAPLFAGGFAGKSGIVIKNLTIADSNIVSTSGLGGGAFVDTADSMQVVTLENCHVVNSIVTGERTGGLIGWVSGYSNQNDGPVKTYVTITNCSVIDSKVIGDGSAGAIAGHPGASDYTYTTIENCVVKNVDVISNDTGSWRTGAVVGTANNGHIVINNVTVENVTLTQNGITAAETKLYGRFVPSGTGTLVIDGAQVVAN